jgi:hypothetical protein
MVKKWVNRLSVNEMKWQRPAVREMTADKLCDLTFVSNGSTKCNQLQIRRVECFSGRGADFRGKIAPPLASCYIYSLASVAFLRWRREMHFPEQHREAFKNRTGSVSTRCVFTDFRVTAPVISLLTTHCYFVCPVITGSLNPKMKKDVANRISYNSFQIGPQKVDHCLLIHIISPSVVESRPAMVVRHNIDHGVVAGFIRCRCSHLTSFQPDQETSQRCRYG